LELTKEHIDELIAKYLAGEALPDEAIWLDDWKAESPENARYFAESEKTLRFVRMRNTDKAKLFQGILQQIEEEQPQQKEAKVVPLKPFFTPLRIAASLVIISLVGIFAAYMMKGQQQGLPEMTIASVDSTQEKQLADGSKVFLNKHTKLVVVGGFNGKARKLKLEGEAFFEVKHDETKPFVIEAGGILIKDIGTAFNVKAEPQSDSVLVSVSEGIVDISNGEQTVQLMANQSVVYVRSTKTLGKIENVSTNVTAYRTKIFHFNAATLGEVLSALNSVYGPIMVLENEELAKCRITVEFKNESPEMIAAIITETLGLVYEERSGQFVIKGASCIQ
jgi:ferric-dicitrate binding protein FerR (iron transport regulator)